MRNLKASQPVLSIFLIVVTWVNSVQAQSLPVVPFDIDFADVSVHLTEPGRMRVQEEVRRMYANQGAMQRDIDALRQLTPVLEPLLKEAGLPSDFRYVALPFADAEINTYWSISESQIRDMDLRVDKLVDERLHPVLTTEVVIPYLKRLHQATHGNYVRTLLQHIRIGNNLPVDQSIQIDPAYALLSPQSPPLIWKILARKLVFEHEEPTYRHGHRYVLYEYANGAGQTLQAIARHLQIGDERLKPFNQWLLTDAVPTTRDYPVLIRVTPDEYARVRKAAEASWKTVTVGEPDLGFPMLQKLQNKEKGIRSLAYFYRINNRRGIQAQLCDNAIALAFYGKITPESFLKYNDLSEHDVIRPGEVYYLEAKAKRASVPFHVVQKSQTLREIAAMYGVKLKSLLRFNRIEPTQRVQTGRIVWLQKKRPQDRPVEYQQLPVEEPKPPVKEEPIITATEATPSSTDLLARQSEANAIPPNSKTLDGDTTAAVVKEVISPNESIKPAHELSDTVVDEAKEKLKLHVVKPGQTYYSIAQMYGVTVAQLYAWNNLSERIPLKVGQELILDTTPKLPRQQTKPKLASTSKAKPVEEKWINSFVIEKTTNAFYHVVQAGQTVYRVALINRVRVKDLMRWNKLKNYTIEIGQKLLIYKRK